MKCVKSCFLLRAPLGYYYRTDLAQITWIKTAQHSVSLGLTESVIQLFIFPSLSKLAGLFQSNLKSSEKEAHQLSREKIIWDRLVCQFLVNGVFSLNNGAQWMFSQTYKEWAWSPSSTTDQKLSQNGQILYSEERERESYFCWEEGRVLVC